MELRIKLNIAKILLLLILVASFSSIAITNSEAASAGQVAVGVYPGGKSIGSYEAELGVKLDYVLQFQDVKKLDYSKITTFLDKGYEVILNVEFFDSFANLRSINEGVYDAYLTSLAGAIRADGREVWLRPLHEFNGDWYNWGTLYPDNSKEDFIPAWRHIVQLFRDKGAPVKFQLNYNRVNGKNDQTPFSVFWPGDEYVDMTVITNYNRAGTDQWHPDSSWEEFKTSFTAAYNQVCELTAKDVGVAETSSTTYGGSKPQWIINTFNSIANDFPRVSQVTWFLLNKKVGNVTWNWDLNTLEEKNSFKRGYEVLKTGDAVFGDSFDAAFAMWSGTLVSSGETATRSATRTRDYIYSAKFTSNGSHGFETAYCYKTLAGASWVSVRGSVYVLNSGIRQDLERMAFVVLRSQGNNVAFAGWRMINGILKWYLSTRDGTGYKTAFSTATPVVYRWYMVEVEWTQSTEGGAVLKVDGKEVCRTESDTSLYGGASQVRFGLAEIYNCEPSTVYFDCCVVQTRS